VRLKHLLFTGNLLLMNERISTEAKKFTKSQVSFFKLLKVPETEYQKVYENYLQYREAKTPVFADYLKLWYQARVREEWRRLHPVYLGD